MLAGNGVALREITSVKVTFPGAVECMPLQLSGHIPGLHKSEVI